MPSVGAASIACEQKCAPRSWAGVGESAPLKTPTSVRLNIHFFFEKKSLHASSQLFIYFLSSSLLLSSLTRKRCYPQRSSEQAAVTGVVLSPPRYVSLVFVAHRVRHCHCSSTFIECSELTLSRFPLVIFLCKKKSLQACTRSDLTRN